MFLDRDGTLNVDSGYLAKPDDVELIPGVVEALDRLRDDGRFRVIVYSNQSGIARGLLDETSLARINDRIADLLGRSAPDAFLHCPHHPSAGDGPYTRVCDCRKPADGLLRDGAALFGIDLSRSFAVGDSARDVLPAIHLGMRSWLVKTGKPIDAQIEALRDAGITHSRELVVDDLTAAVDQLLMTTS